METNQTIRRLKILCSFGGSILPRPYDGKLRYVGGETRIVSLPRDVRYADLMSRMKEIFDGVVVLKYQQPDEDLDALVSVVNDDDVVNMMEEYDKKIGEGEDEGEGEEGGCAVVARLRIFLFSHLDDHMSGSISSPNFDPDEVRETERRYLDALNSVPDCWTDEGNEQATFGDGMDFHGNQFSNLHKLKIHRVPSNGSFYSPGHSTPRDQLCRDFSGSPSSGRFYGGMNEFGDNEFSRQPQSNVNSPFGDGMPSVVWVPPGAGVVDKSGFPGNLGHDHGSWSDGNNICEHCHMAMQRNHGSVGEAPRFHGIYRNICEPCQPIVDNIGFGIDFGGQSSSSSCAECIREREIYLFNQEMKMDHGGHSIEHTEHRNFYSDMHGHDRDWILRNEMSGHRSVQYDMDDGGRNFPYMVGKSYNNGLHMPPNYIGRDDHQYIHPSNEQGNKLYHDQHVVGTGPRFHGLSMEDVSLSIHSPRKTHGSLHPFPMHEPPGMMQRTSGFFSTGSNQPLKDEIPVPIHAHVGIDNHLNPSMGHTVNLQQHILPINETAVPEQCHVDTKKVTLDVLVKDNMQATRDSNDNCVASASLVNKASPCYSHVNAVETTGILEVSTHSNGFKYQEEKLNLVTPDKNNGTSGLPKVSDSVKKVALECIDIVTTEAQVSNFDVTDHEKNENTLHGLILKNDPTSDSDDNSDKSIISKIEPTLAEEEAFNKGLQTIKNDDLEEIRKLGTGAYGAVYHGKWRGADIAIKRIKASCFSGTPSERERLIADFWKEASILSSLHHPNVVSFYGVVRDGPDGSLATATEFMINGSLKQFLRKKDRTIDRRKRLILAMDAAFGMEYLHLKNIVHFDLKCENLLVNMRDPHRPVCKIGDLGLSKVKQHTLVSGGVRGTLPWMAPELLSGKTNMVTEKIDVYSFGIVMWELLTGEDPYADLNSASIIGSIVNNSLRPQVPSWCDPEWKSLMESCWVSNPLERPSFSEISQKLREMSAVINKK